MNETVNVLTSTVSALQQLDFPAVASALQFQVSEMKQIEVDLCSLTGVHDEIRSSRINRSLALSSYQFATGVYGCSPQLLLISEILSSYVAHRLVYLSLCHTYALNP